MRRVAHVDRYLHLSGCGPFSGAELVFAGKVGRDLTLQEGVEAARLTALNMVRVLLEEGYDLDRIRWVKVLGMVNSDPAFTDQPTVVNGFSEVIVDIFGDDRGLPARSACGMASMPWDMAIEIEATCRLEDD
jgi:enamine deaminase RidA (YjgF/YER057c/UK114 family)